MSKKGVKKWKTSVIKHSLLNLSNIQYNCRFVTISFYIANEGLSILENAINSGLPVPDKLREVLEQCKKSKTKKQ